MRLTLLCCLLRKYINMGFACITAIQQINAYCTESEFPR